MPDVLSQSEVESLLAALDPSAKSGDANAPGGAGAEIADFGAHVSVYDFKRPERVSKDQMRAFQALHEGFSREFGAALSGLLRSIVEVKLISVDQLTYSEFVFSLENPTCFCLLEAKPLEGHFILDLNPSIIFPVVDRLLGGGKTVTSIPRRPLTEIEQILVSRITDRAIKGLKDAWSNVAELDLRVTQIESNPQLVQIVPPNEVIMLISFEITMGESRGVMNLCIPYNTIEPLASRISANSWTNYTQKKADPQQILNLERNVASAKVEVVVYLADTRITSNDLMGLEVGDIITTEKDSRGALLVSVEGRPKFEARGGVHKDRKAIRITRPLDQSGKPARAG